MNKLLLAKLWYFPALIDTVDMFNVGLFPAILSNK